MTDDPQAERYRTPEVEAVQWTGDNADQMRAFCSPFDFQEIEPEDRVEDPDQTAAVRESAHGTWRGLAPGDWAVRRGNDFFEVSAADFARQYEPAVPSAPADRAASTAPLAAGLPLVKGNCPACQRASLFLGSGGYVTCSSADCPEPDAATTVLEGDANWPAVRAAVLRELASSIQGGNVPFNTEAAEAALKNGGPFALIAYVQLAIGEQLRRRADEAQQPETRQSCACGQDGCEYCDVDEADEEQSESGACTCAAAGDCFAPAGHYADCPAAAVSQPAREA